MTEKVEERILEEYDAGLLNDFGGGDVGWWQDYIRAELGRAYDFYHDQFADILDAYKASGEAYAAERKARIDAQEDCAGHVDHVAREMATLTAQLERAMATLRACITAHEMGTYEAAVGAYETAKTVLSELKGSKTDGSA